MTKIVLTPKTLSFREIDFKGFIERLPDLKAFAPDISKLRDTGLIERSKNVAGEVFACAIELIKTELRDRRTGIIAADIPESSDLTVDENAFWGVVMATAIASNVFNLSRDRINGTPFTAYAASYEKSHDLVQFGLPTVAPETKLGFHTDGVTNGNNVSMPRNIMLYNVVIEYKRPGSFHWVPFQSWSDKTTFMSRVGVGKRYSIRLTPSIYDLGAGKLQIASPDTVQVPIFLDDKKNNYPLYINGTVIDSEDRAGFDASLFETLKQSIANNGLRYSIPQKSR